MEVSRKYPYRIIQLKYLLIRLPLCSSQWIWKESSSVCHRIWRSATFHFNVRYSRWCISQRSCCNKDTHTTDPCVTRTRRNICKTFLWWHLRNVCTAFTFIVCREICSINHRKPNQNRTILEKVTAFFSVFLSFVRKKRYIFHLFSINCSGHVRKRRFRGMKDKHVC